MIGVRYRGTVHAEDCPAQPEYQSEELHRMVHVIRSIGLNFVAIDFDKTLVSIHTFGTWPGNAPDLSTKVRPFFLEFIPLLMGSNVSVGIVTFPGQVKLIQQVIQIVFPDLASNIPVRGHDQSWAYHGEGSAEGKQKHMASAAEDINNSYGSASFFDENHPMDINAGVGVPVSVAPRRDRDSTGALHFHGASAAQESGMHAYGHRAAIGRVPITRASTLLIDDDLNNILAALNNGVRAVFCDPDRTRNMMDDLLSLI
jgi:hypothetical protein